jgi:hypothetical protein
MTRTLALQLGVAALIAGVFVAWRSPVEDSGFEGFPTLTQLQELVENLSQQVARVRSALSLQSPAGILLASGGGLLLIATYGNRIGVKA